MGKSSIIYVIGLSLMVAYSLMNISSTSTSSVDNYTAYYGRTMAHNIALAGANIGAQLILATPTFSTNLLDQQFSGGSYNMYVQKLGGGDSAKIKVYSRIDVSGETIRDTVLATFKYTPFSKYGWFTEAEKNGYVGSPYYGASDWKITGDSVYGYAHTNSKFNLGGTPYFNDKVTATNAPTLMKVNGVSAPVYKSGYQWGITVTRPVANLTNLTAAATAGGLLIPGSDAALTFFPSGAVAVKIPPSNGSIRNDTVQLSTLAPNGVIAVTGGDLRVTGTYHGKVTVAALKGVTTNKGNVWIDGNGIIASDNPQTNPSSQDMMGIVSEQSTYITKDNGRNMSSTVTIQAAVYCWNGELTAEEFWKIGVSGRVNLYGGVTQKTAGSLGVFTGSGLTHGMYYTVRHDERFNFSAPPSFPVSDKYELISWWEN